MPKNSGAGQYPVWNSWSDKIYQPPFDSRTTRLTFQGKDGVLQSGRIISAPAKKATMGYIDRVGVLFLYNPSEISLAYSADPNAPIPAELNNPSNVGQTLNGTGSLSFNLLFDRTYDTWGQGARMNKNTADGITARYGVYVDVRQFYLMLGMVRPHEITLRKSNHTVIDWDIPGYELQTGPMISTPVQVYFGGKESLTYYGRVTSFNVTYTHWTRRMTPNRAVINLSMDTWVKPKTWKNFKDDKGGADQTSGSETTSSSGTTP
jgi:hypothetical protein